MAGGVATRPIADLDAYRQSDQRQHRQGQDDHRSVAFERDLPCDDDNRSRRPRSDRLQARPERGTARADHRVVAALPPQHAVKNDLSGFAARKEEAADVDPWFPL